MKKIISYIHSFIAIEHVLLVIVLVVSFFAHATNMLHFPYIENDEGTYISQAWSILQLGKLAPYTYWYDHAPGGWMLLALWGFVTGGFFRFGLAVDSGRVFMLILQVVSTYFIFDISRKTTRQPWVGFIASLIFSLTPLGIYFHRRILLDNIMVFWFLVSWWLLVVRELTLSRIILSALALGMSIVSKENALLFAPVLGYVVVTRRSGENRLIAVSVWVTIVLSIVSFYVVYALSKNEFFPSSSNQHVSLVNTLISQATRGTNLPFWFSKSDFMTALSEWLKKDSLLTIFGLVATGICSALSFRFSYFRIPTLLTVCMTLFFLRGGLVIDFYVVALLPLWSILIAYLIDAAIYILSQANVLFYRIIHGLFSCFIVFYYLTHSIGVYHLDETSFQRKALSWVYENIPKNAIIAVDAYGLVDLWKNGYTNAHWFWKLWSDPEIAAKIDNSWTNIQYIMLTHEMVRSMESKLNGQDMLRDAFLSSESLMQFGPSLGTYLDLNKFKSTNGDWVRIVQVASGEQKILSSAWRGYKERFFTSYGQIVDKQGNQTTSEGQAYGMLQAVLEKDRSSFDGIWLWTQHKLENRTQDSLLSWLYKDGGIVDSGVATDADLDVAYALLLAYKTWGDEKYKNSAVKLIDDLWSHTVVQIGSEYVLTSSADSFRKTGYLVNPSYFSPAYYRIFAAFDQKHPWTTLVDNTYTILRRIQSSTLYGKKAKLPPNWILVKFDGSIGDATAYVANDDVGVHGYDAFRIFHRIALDLQMFQSEDARLYLTDAAKFFASVFTKDKELASTYAPDGSVLLSYPDISMKTGACAALFAVHDELAGEICSRYIDNRFDETLRGWGDVTNYYDQNWAFFSSALRSGLYKNPLTDFSGK